MLAANQMQMIQGWETYEKSGDRVALFRWGDSARGRALVFFNNDGSFSWWGEIVYRKHGRRHDKMIRGENYETREAAQRSARAGLKMLHTAITEGTTTS